jgi:hypothetical protein
MTSLTFQYPFVPIANSELRKIKSTIVGQEYQVKIRLPERYTETHDPYPILYLLDGDHAFAMATDIVQYLVYENNIPDLIIVSPAYDSKKYPSEGGKNMRLRDLLPFPTRYSDLKPGAATYLEFLEQELMPFVESNYRTKVNDRSLWGYSGGAFFALYTLFQKTSLFQRYIIVDGFDERFCGMEETYAAQHMELPVRLFLSGCPREFGADLAKFFDRLCQRKYTDFHAKYAELNDIGHFAVPAEGLVKGLVSVFN